MANINTTSRAMFNLFAWKAERLLWEKDVAPRVREIDAERLAAHWSAYRSKPQTAKRREALRRLRAAYAAMTALYSEIDATGRMNGWTDIDHAEPEDVAIALFGLAYGIRTMRGTALDDAWATAAKTEQATYVERACSEPLGVVVLDRGEIKTVEQTADFIGRDPEFVRSAALRGEVCYAWIDRNMAA